MTVLLSVLTLANVIALVSMAALAANEAAHGGLDDDQGTVLASSMVICLVGLVGLGGAWSVRKWGPRLYLVAVVVDRIVALVVTPEFFSPLFLVGIALAVLLVGIAESNW